MSSTSSSSSSSSSMNVKATNKIVDTIPGSPSIIHTQSSVSTTTFLRSVDCGSYNSNSSGFSTSCDKRLNYANSSVASSFDDLDMADQNVKYKILHKCEGSSVDALNDVIVFPMYENEHFKSDSSARAKYNFIYFGGDIQDYPEEMAKNPTNRSFLNWNLLKTGRRLGERINNNSLLEDTHLSNIFVIRADHFHLKCFANYSNFVKSTHFGVPLCGSNFSDINSTKIKAISKLNLVLSEKESNDSSSSGVLSSSSSSLSSLQHQHQHQHHGYQQQQQQMNTSHHSSHDMSSLSNSSSASNINIYADDETRCWTHLHKLLLNAIDKFNADVEEANDSEDENRYHDDPDYVQDVDKEDDEEDDEETSQAVKSEKKKKRHHATFRQQIDPSLPIVLCGFSKGCIVLNELCKELVNFEHHLDLEDEQAAADLISFKNQVKHLIWLDGGHCGTSNAWLVSDETINAIKQENIACYVYVTPYQMKSSKKWAIEEYKQFVELLHANHVKMKNEYYFRDKEDDYDINIHFEILNRFDISFF